MRALYAIALAVLPCSAWAQDSDKDFLTSYLEENLSGAGRVVTITGFSGALSTRATLERMTIADDLGVWLTVADVTLDWSQSALLSGQVIINEFSAGEIDLQRIPAGDGGGMSAEARPITVPDLPVSIDINKIEARHIILGPDVLGQAVEGTLTAAMQLADGDATVKIDLTRTDDGPEGQFAIAATYLGKDAHLDLDVTAREGAGGVAVGLLGVPGAPSAEVSIVGSGPMSDFSADISLRTDEVTRLAGRVVLTGDAEGKSFTADLSGDPTPVFLPDYAEFFGPDVSLHLQGRRFADGRTELSQLHVQAQALVLDGSFAADATGLPVAFDLTGEIGLPDGPVVLPLSTDQKTSLDSGRLNLKYDRAVGEFWSATTELRGLSNPQFTAEKALLTGTGLFGKRGEVASFAGSLTYGVAGLALTDPGLAQALGREVSGEMALDWQSGRTLDISKLTLLGAGFDLAGGISVKGLDTGFDTEGHLDGQAADLSRFAILAGLPLKGQADFTTKFDSNLISGVMDVSGTLQGVGLGLGVATLDNLLQGTSTVEFSGWRDANGTTINTVLLKTTGFEANAGGRITSDGLDLTGGVTMESLRVLGLGYGGGFEGKATLTGPLSAAVLTLDATGQSLTIGQPQADILLRGSSKFAATLGLTDGGLSIRTLDVVNPQVRVGIKGSGGQLVIDQRISDLGLLYPQFPGALVAKGTAVKDATGYAVDLTATGPAQIDARIKGRLASNFVRADLAISGTASAGLANKLAAPRSLSGPVRFDLRMVGPIGLASLSGPVSLTGGRLADPDQTFGIKNIEGTAQLSGGRARVSGRGTVSTGGNVGVEGTVGILQPYAADLAISVEGVVLRDPNLYTTRVDGAVTLRGPALGPAMLAGTVTLGRTELLIPSSGFGSDGELPGLEHVREADDSQATRARAGQVGGGGGGVQEGSGYQLNLRILAPAQIFIRGRGLDAELGGSLTLRGSTGGIIPSGAFSLIRGRLDFLGKRLDLSEALLQLQGALVPFVRIVASVESDGITASVLIEGPANDPTVSFTSNPSLPQEEVLARLLFDRGLTNLTAFQAIQLAGAVATLAGRGGAGLVGNLRKKAGLDNLDITTDGAGNAAVTVGKYLTDKAYSEVTVDQGGKSSVSINLDVAPHITLKGHVDSDGQTGIGIFLQRDY